MNRIFKVSIVLNFLLALGLIVALAHYGFFGKVVEKISGEEVSESSVIDAPYYKTRNDLFNNAGDNSDEIVFLGDSISDINEWGNAFPDLNIINRGINGDTTFGVLNRLDNIIKLKPKKVFILIGINDITKGVSDEDILKNYDSIISTLKEGSPDTEIYIQSVLPTNQELASEYYQMKTNNDTILATNQEIENMSKSQNVVYVDLYKNFIDTKGQLDAAYTIDGIHLNAKGYKIWEEVLKVYLD